MIQRIKVGMATCGIAAGASEVKEKIEEVAPDEEIVEVGCIGHCYAEPLVEIETEEGSIFYEDVEPEKEFIEKMLNLEEENRFEPPSVRQEWEEQYVLGLAGDIDPTSFQEYEENSGFTALKKALEMEPEEIVEEVKTSGLRGRGGGGFPTGMKWDFLASSGEKDKVMICNADEGDPGAFMDRTLMESLPHQVLEGMLIGAYATGANQLFIYCRAEYPLAVERLNIAIEQIEEKGLNNLNGMEVEITVKEGAGAFVCGEETAMIHSLEGKRGNPRYRPPYPTDEGFKGRPTLINNVETFSNIPLLVREGGEQFSQVGTENSTGTKLFALAGDLEYSGLVEVPMGISIHDVVYGIGGAEEGSVKAVQIGGPSGGCIPAEHFDTPVDYDSLTELGAIMGSGGLIVISEGRCMVETARYFLDFTTEESCGKCTFCRVGTKRMLEKLERITNGEGTEKDIQDLDDLGRKIIDGSLCGLGQTAPNPVLTTLKYFRGEYESHVEEDHCPALECDELVEIYLDRDICIECENCIESCPVDAIDEEFQIDDEACTRCNSCIEVCPVDAISRVRKGGKVDVQS
ncbi:NADH-ubiquinone oxidoreductase-F iron-sulfur binding region domain-containing protein [Halarsenatibacter silvermanii]|uniref:NADH-quinone oxidoreductase subunit F n=1 Tax=Halarsenatibacter silvermanii TaxID=321763 RepID=A0A1G9PLK8_9FIRM|nr:NADH-ubiquinone oxidoreductase-F iron-sulfur binding region domain-containing protein [Halarsenatibacter silvermanii]SDL99599.1 NADH-quinone oxidoreductase subunit F [Halarsenatibacter silvermanii]